MKTILIVDDSSVVRMSLNYFLKENDYNVIEAVDGSDGFDKAMKNKADLIISDINMPIMNGIEMIQKLREQQETKYTPILVLTTESGKDMLDQGKKAGATGWIVKPFTNESLLATIKKVIG